MEKEMILLSEYCQNSCAEPDFILRLEEEGLISTETHEALLYIHSSQLHDLDLFTRLHYELSINVEGIDVINNLLAQIRRMDRELSLLRRRQLTVDNNQLTIDS